METEAGKHWDRDMDRGLRAMTFSPELLGLVRWEQSGQTESHHSKLNNYQRGEMACITGGKVSMYSPDSELISRPQLENRREAIQSLAHSEQERVLLHFKVWHIQLEQDPLLAPHQDWAWHSNTRMGSNKLTHAPGIKCGPASRGSSDRPSYRTLSHMQRAQFGLMEAPQLSV